MSEKNAEEVQQKPVTPAPATETPNAEATANPSAEVVKPAEAKAEKSKETVAFIKMRQEMREMKRQLAAQVTTPPPPTATPETKPEAQVTNTPSVTAPAPKAEVDIEAESAKAIEALAGDQTIARVPGAIIDIVAMVDNDTRLTRLHAVDPILAFREAKALYLEKAGITEPPPVPKAVPVSGGITGGKKDLTALYAEIDKHRAGSKEFMRLAREIETANKEQ